MFLIPIIIAFLVLCDHLCSSNASCCNISDFLDDLQSFLVPIPGVACLRVQVYVGGKIQVDPNDSTCTEENFLPQSIANFDDYSGNVVTYAEGQLGYKSTVIIIEDASLSEVAYDLNAGGEFIEIVIKVPSCPYTTHTPTQVPLTQREVLIDLYESTNGDNWALNDNWLSSVTECDWYGVVCNSNGNVIELDLSNNDLAGTIPDSIGYLSNVRTLDLWLNNLNGTIPDSIGNLSNVRRLDLVVNDLTGTIPDSIGYLSNMEALFLTSNDLTGTIPDSIGYLSNVGNLQLYLNTLNGTIPDSIGNLSNVQYLDLHNNLLTGTIPDSIGNLSKLAYHYLYNNALTGTIPNSIGNLSNLESFYLHNNELTGTIPPEVCELNIRDFLYYDNNIEGDCD